jgi:DNA modification methylase
MTVRVITGDALTELAKLPAESVHCCVTSPPYYGLRDYGTASWEGGDPACDHKGMALASSSSSLAGYTSETVKVRTHTMPQGQTCAKCGAVRIDAQLGLESTPDEYVAAMVAVFHEVRRVLRSDGTLWLNIGDSYAGSGKGGNPDAGKQATNTADGIVDERGQRNRDGVGPVGGDIKGKDLIGIPWMLAFALRADGWWLRQDIIWAKPNPMPESVTDRCTKAHEYLFLLSKSDRYYFDAAAIAEPTVSEGRIVGAHSAAARDDVSDVNDRRTAIFLESEYTVLGTRNKRSVWTVGAQPFPEAHFATFPPALVEPCIRAGSPSGGTVLDPFAGAGTTLLVADRLVCNAIGIELNPIYAEMARRRIKDECPLFADVAAD